MHATEAGRDVLGTSFLLLALTETGSPLGARLETFRVTPAAVRAAIESGPTGEPVHDEPVRDCLDVDLHRLWSDLRSWHAAA